MRVPGSELEYGSDLVHFHNGRLFTGIAYEEDPDGGRSEVSFRNGLQDGPARDWYPSGKLRSESYFYENVPHGPDREFDENGVVRSESVFEYGILLSRAQWDEDGGTVESTELGNESDNYRRLERYRTEKRWPRISEGA